jgi:hypothetical protein
VAPAAVAEGNRAGWRVGEPAMLRGFMVENRVCCDCTTREEKMVERQGLPLLRPCELRPAFGMKALSRERLNLGHHCWCDFSQDSFLDRPDILRL